MSPTKRYHLRHQMSVLRDRAFDVEIDEGARLVTVRVVGAGLDAALLGRLVTETLPNDAGVCAFRDNNSGMPAPPADYRLLVWIGDIKLEVDVVKPLPGAGFTDPLVYLRSVLAERLVRAEATEGFRHLARVASELVGGGFDGAAWLRRWLGAPSGHPDFDGRPCLDVFEEPGGADRIETLLRRQVSGVYW